MEETNNIIINEEESNKPDLLNVMMTEETKETSETSEISKDTGKRGRKPGYKRTQESINKMVETRKRNKIIMQEPKAEPQENEQENLY